jgi:aminopeptidase N
LLREQQGGGAEYRVATLQKYADYVRGGKDFPLIDFRSRHSPSTEAVGYGKSMMLFHMLRLELGDDNFKKGLREFYRKYKFRFATFDDIRTTFEAVSGTDLTQEFRQWAQRPGAPQLAVRKPAVRQEKNGFVLTATIEQTQPGEAYRLRVPLAATMEGRARAFQTTVLMTGKKLELTLPLPARPERLDIDPEFDLFRRLGREEVPPAVSLALGARKMLVILPSGAGENALRAYREFSRSLSRSGPDEVEVKLDSEVTELPDDRSVMVLGWENRFSPEVFSALEGYGLSVTDRTVRIDRAIIDRGNHVFVLTARLPKNRDMAFSLIAADLPGALPGLAAKLPHYHTYSYLAFEGAEPANVAKGRWRVVDSPLTAFVPDEKGTIRKVEMAGLAPRGPLASLESPFSRERMMETIRFLAGEDLGGRGFGTPGLDKAADYIARQFKAAGLAPGGDEEGGFFQAFEDIGGEAAQTAILKNVIGVIPGRKPELKQQSVVIGAHYDHLGLGWPEGRHNNRGKIHPGADDNASGVAVLIELAWALAKGPRPDRTIVFVAFTGEEAGRRGSKYYAAHEKPWPVLNCIGMVNLDTVGRLGKNKLLVLGAGSAKEWAHIFRGAGFVTGVDIELVSAELDASDQKSFQEAGVPAVQLFSGPNLDYHRSTDTVDKIDADGLVKVASVAKESVEYLSGREEPLTVLSTGDSAGTSPKGPRKASLGTIPDFAYQGKGLRISGVVPGSPAEAAGMKEGDIIVRVNSTPVAGLKDFSDVLKSLNPGDKVSVTFVRDGKESAITSQVTER